MWIILKLLGGYSQIIGGIYPPILPCFGTTGFNGVAMVDTRQEYNL